ncbi:MAG TPA: sulfatase-like hydrolase/transferase [Pseudomonadales bacterium]|nr:sulfatase-like hydrolase/transferase [Pseudomonadales bacterium]
MRKLLIAFFLFVVTLQIQAEDRKPNILLIVLDDAGYSDVAGFGRDDAPTPNIKQIANEGVRFTRHYADSTCRPARLALMTGRESARVAQNPDFRGISPEITTLPEALKTAGYHTSHIGKWHLGDAVRDSWPDKQGFEHWFGFLNQFQLKGPDKNGDFTKRPTYIDPWLQSDNTPLQQYHGHLEDILAARVIETINNTEKNQPWFINYWLFAPHHPSTASAEFLKKYPDTQEGKYRALLAQADAEIGKVVQALRDSKQLDNTLIVVVSDNGGTNQMMNNNAPYAGVKGEFREGSLRTPLIIRWPDQRAAGKQLNEIVAIQDIYPTLLHAAGVDPEKNIDGQDLQPLLAGRKLTPRTLIHEIGSFGLFNYSLLSTDGQWRASPAELYALEKEPSGTTNVVKQFLPQSQKMENEYTQWRNEKTKLTLQYTPITTQGMARIYGDDFRRAPGYGAFSFAIGAVMPDKQPTEPVYLAWQKNVWSLAYNPDNTFTLQIGNDKISSLPLTKKRDSQCIPIVLSSWYTRSRLHEGRNTAYAKLYAGDEKILDWQTPNPEEINADWSAPTWIGQDENDKNRWPVNLDTHGLSVPLFYNSSLNDDPAAKFDRLQNVQQIVCLPPAQ